MFLFFFSQYINKDSLGLFVTVRGEINKKENWNVVNLFKFQTQSLFDGVGAPEEV